MGNLENNLLLLFLLGVITTGGGSGLLAANATGTATTEGRGEREVDVLLGVETDHERDTGVVDGLGETKLVDAGLETALEEIVGLEGKDVIELHAGLIEHTDADKTANEGIAFEETLGVLLVESKELTVGKMKN